MLHHNTSNGTKLYTGSCVEPGEGFIIYVIARFIVSVIIIAVNSLFVGLYCWRRRRLLKVPSDRLLFSLTICDFLTGISVTLSAICNVYRTLTDKGSSIGVTFRIMEDCYTLFLVISVVMHFCGVTIDRYIALFYALSYKSVVTTKSVNYYIAFSWTVPLIASSIPLMWLYRVIRGQVHPHDLDMISNIEIWYSMTAFAIFLAIPMILLATVFLAMFVEIRRLIRSPPGRSTVTRCWSRQRRVISAFCLMYFTFLILAMPYFSLRLWIDICFWREHAIEYRLNINVVRLTIITKNITSIVNPIFYQTVSPELRNTLRELQARVMMSVPVDTVRRLSANVLKEILYDDVRLSEHDNIRKRETLV